jgi:hypothetical protein
MLVHQAGRAIVGAPAAEEGASLATPRWCRSRDCRRRAMSGCCYPCYYCRSRQSCYSSLSPSLCSYPCLLSPLFGWDRRGRATRGHDSSCCGGCYCCGGCPLPKGAEVCPWATELSSSIFLSSRSLRTVWKEGNGYDGFMKIFI